SGVGTVSPFDIKPPRDLSAMHQSRWAKLKDINVINAPHILRPNVVTNLRATKLGLPITPTVYTEAGWGKMSDLPDHDPSYYPTMDAYYPPSDGARSLDGGLSYRHLYQKAYPQWSLEQALVEQLAWLDGILPPNVEGILIYGYGTGDDGQDYGGNRELHRLMVQKFKAGTYNPPKPPVTPPARENWALCMASPVLPGNVNFRPQIGTDNIPLRTIGFNTPCLVWFEGIVKDKDGYRWLPMQIAVKGVTMRGYARRDLLRVWYVK
ncbi:MAG: hypothetical protein SFZ02_17890, partial [bacterium]|nr:hypothetical protein [bacterium]